MSGKRSAAGWVPLTARHLFLSGIDGHKGPCPIFLPQLLSPLPWLVGRYSFTSAQSKEGRRAKSKSKVCFWEHWSFCLLYPNHRPAGYPRISLDPIVPHLQTGAWIEPDNICGSRILIYWLGAVVSLKKIRLHVLSVSRALITTSSLPRACLSSCFLCGGCIYL